MRRSKSRTSRVRQRIFGVETDSEMLEVQGLEARRLRGTGRPYRLARSARCCAPLPRRSRPPCRVSGLRSAGAALGDPLQTHAGRALRAAAWRAHSDLWRGDAFATGRAPAALRLSLPLLLRRLWGRRASCFVLPSVDTPSNPRRPARGIAGGVLTIEGRPARAALSFVQAAPAPPPRPQGRGARRERRKVSLNPRPAANSPEKRDDDDDHDPQRHDPRCPRRR